MSGLRSVHGGDGFHAQFMGTAENVGRARSATIEFLRSFVSSERILLLETAVGEALTNAVVHGCSDGGSVSVRAKTTAARIEVEVCDTGRGFDYRHIIAADPLTFPTHGMGIGLMRGLVDDVRYSLGGTCVTLIVAR